MAAKIIYESEFPNIIHIVNNLPAPVDSEGAVDVNDLSKCSCDERVWNTGLKCVRGAQAVICDDTLFALPELKKNEIPVIVYGNRGERFILKPGEQVNLTAETDEQVKFYIDQFSPIKGLTVTLKNGAGTVYPNVEVAAEEPAAPETDPAPEESTGDENA